MTENRINEDPEEFRETLKLRDGWAFADKQIKVQDLQWYTDLVCYCKILLNILNRDRAVYVSKVPVFSTDALIALFCLVLCNYKLL